MSGSKTKILLISASGKTGGGPSHIFLLKELLKDEFDFYLAMPFIDPKIQNYNKKKYLQICERRISLIDILRLMKILSTMIYGEVTERKQTLSFLYFYRLSTYYS